MRRLVLTAATAAATLAVSPPAQAHPEYHYEGGCFVTATSVSFAESPTWTFTVDIAVVTTDAFSVPAPLAATSVDCHLKVDGSWRGVIASGASTIGVVTSHTSVTVSAPYGAAVEICPYVIIDGEGEFHCEPVTLVHPDETACKLAFGGNDVSVEGKTVYDCPPYDG